jgi:hypothetical protein
MPSSALRRDGVWLSGQVSRPGLLWLGPNSPESDAGVRQLASALGLVAPEQIEYTFSIPVTGQPLNRMSESHDLPQSLGLPQDKTTTHGALFSQRLETTELMNC